jgi:hypothetical protein
MVRNKLHLSSFSFFSYSFSFSLYHWLKREKEKENEKEKERKSMKKYLLPCECGQNVEVDAGQAGLAVTCACGKTLEVPTMRGLSALPVAESRVEADGAPARAAWGPGQGLMFLGTIAAISGVIALGVVFQTRPKWTVQAEHITAHVDQLTPAQLLERWHDLRKGLSAADDPVRQRYEADWSTYRRRLTMSAIPLGLGILMLAGGFALSRAGKARRQ